MSNPRLVSGRPLEISDATKLTSSPPVVSGDQLEARTAKTHVERLWVQWRCESLERDYTHPKNARAAEKGPATHVQLW